MTQTIHSFVREVSGIPDDFKLIEYQPNQPIKRNFSDQQLFHISMVVRQSALGAMSEYIYCSIPPEISGGRFHEYLTPVTQIKNLDGALPVNLPILKFGDDGKLYVGLFEFKTKQIVTITVTKLL